MIAHDLTLISLLLLLHVRLRLSHTCSRTKCATCARASAAWASQRSTSAPTCTVCNTTATLAGRRATRCPAKSTTNRWSRRAPIVPKPFRSSGANNNRFSRKKKTNAKSFKSFLFWYLYIDIVNLTRIVCSLLSSFSCYIHIIEVSSDILLFCVCTLFFCLIAVIVFVVVVVVVNSLLEIIRLIFCRLRLGANLTFGSLVHSLC